MQQKIIKVMETQRIDYSTIQSKEEITDLERPMSIDWQRFLPILSINALLKECLSQENMEGYSIIDHLGVYWFLGLFMQKGKRVSSFCWERTLP